MKKAETPANQDPNTPESGYFLITSDSFIFIDPSLNVVLYPGVSAVITADQYSRIPDWTQSMLTVKEISEVEFTALFKKSGVMGIIR